MLALAWWDREWIRRSEHLVVMDTVPTMDRRTRRHCLRLTHGVHTDRVQATFERASLEPMGVRLVEVRLRDAGRNGRPLLGANEGSGTVSVFNRVLGVAARVYPREVARIQERLRHETEQRRP